MYFENELFCLKDIMMQRYKIKRKVYKNFNLLSFGLNQKKVTKKSSRLPKNFWFSTGRLNRRR